MTDRITAAFDLELEEFRLNLEVAIPASGITGVFGPSGSGKTTFLRCLAGLEPRARGHLKVGRDTWHSDSVFMPPNERAIGFVFQESRLFSHLTVRENLEYGWKRTRPADREIGFDEVVQLLDIAPVLRRAPTSLSGGEAKRVAIGRALLRSPAMLLLDEPLAGLDSARKSEIMPYLDRLHRRLDIPILYVSHDLEEVCRLADTIMVMDQGRLVRIGPTTEVLIHLDPSRYAMALSVALPPAAAAQSLGLDLTAAHNGPVRIAARDVSLSREEIAPASALAVVGGRVTDIGAKAGGLCAVTVETRGVTLISLLNERAEKQLSLAAGDHIYATIWHATAGR